jgi:hypothetical protein
MCNRRCLPGKRSNTFDARQRRAASGARWASTSTERAVRETGVTAESVRVEMLKCAGVYGGGGGVGNARGEGVVKERRGKPQDHVWSLVGGYSRRFLLRPVPPQLSLCGGDGLGAPDSVLGRAGPKRPLGHAAVGGQASSATQIPLGGALGRD